MRTDVPAAAPPPIERPQPRSAPVAAPKPRTPTPPPQAATQAACEAVSEAPAAPSAPRTSPLDDGPYEISPAGSKWRHSTRPRGRGADFDNARDYFTMPDLGAWMNRMADEPSIFTHILSDIFRETRAEQERLAGQAKIGRRPKVIEGSLSELWDMVTPKYAVAPFPEALKALAGVAVSPAEFQHKTMIAPDTYRRMLQGEALDMWRLEVVARAYAVSPAYFREWRIDYVLTVVAELLTSQPNLSIKYARFLGKLVGDNAKRRNRKRQPIAAG